MEQCEETAILSGFIGRRGIKLLDKEWRAVTEMALVLERGSRVRVPVIIAGGSCSHSYSNTFPIKTVTFLGSEI